MNTAAKTVIPTIPGTPFEGGFFVSTYRVADATYALIDAGTAGECGLIRWIDDYKDVPGACSFNDGAANTEAMVEAGSDLAKKIRALQIGGFSDWFLPSQNELELLYRHLKPTTEGNWGHSGANPSALPPTHQYTDEAPVQTSAEAFREGGAQAFESAAYFSSTQSSRYYAWFQYFVGGSQYFDFKSAELRARAVRRFKVE